MTILQAIIYGIVQGITEFLPVSSSGHLAILPHVFSIQDPGVVFDLAMHVGTALAVTVYFQKDVKKLFIETVYLFNKKKSDKLVRPYVLNLWISIIGTIILAFLIKGLAESYGRNPQLIAFNLILFGVIMLIADKFCFQNEDQYMSKEVRPFKAALIGLSQALALFPGVSRSGATLSISRILKINRVEAARYSFLLSLPVILGGMLFKVRELFKEEAAFALGDCFIGILVSFVVGILTIHFFLKLIAKLGLYPFAIYRIIFAIFIFVYYSSH